MDKDYDQPHEDWWCVRKPWEVQTIETIEVIITSHFFFHQLVYYCYSDALELSFNHAPHTPGIEAAKDVTFCLYYH